MSTTLSNPIDYQLFIDGEWADPASGEWFDTVEPYSGEVWARIPLGIAADADRAVRAAHAAFMSGPWSALTATQRAAMLCKLAALIKENADHLGRVEQRDNGKLITEVRGQVMNIAQWFYYYAGLADKIGGDVIPVNKPGVINYTRIVFDDADLDQALKGVISGIFAAAGQTCMAGSRLLLQDSIHNDFVERLVALTRQARIGDPSLPETQLGPIATRQQWEHVMRMIETAKAEGARCVLGGHALTGQGYGQGQFVASHFTGVDNQMAIARQEVFGPVLSVIRFRDEDEALRLANDTPEAVAGQRYPESAMKRLESGR